MTSRTRTACVYHTEHGSFLRRRFKEVWRTQPHLRGTGQSYACPRRASKVGRYRYFKTGAIFSTLSFNNNTSRFPSMCPRTLLPFFHFYPVPHSLAKHPTAISVSFLFLKQSRTRLLELWCALPRTPQNRLLSTLPCTASGWPVRKAFWKLTGIVIFTKFFLSALCRMEA